MNQRKASEQQRWTTFSDWQPYFVLITDFEWWDSNRDTIDEWFDSNCPSCKPEPADTLIRFDTKNHYTQWVLTWS